MKGIKLAIASLIAGATLVTLPVTAAEKPVDLNALLNQVKASSLSESQLNKEREARFLADKNEQGALLAKAKADGAKVVDGDLKSFQAVGAKIRDQYTAKNPLIADFYKQAKGL